MESGAIQVQSKRCGGWAVVQPDLDEGGVHRYAMYGTMPLHFDVQRTIKHRCGRCIWRSVIQRGIQTFTRIIFNRGRSGGGQDTCPSDKGRRGKNKLSTVTTTWTTCVKGEAGQAACGAVPIVGQVELLWRLWLVTAGRRP